MKNQDVARGFVRGEVKSTENFSATEREVFSYRMKIAERLAGGEIAVINKGPSKTTSRHINMVVLACVAEGVEYIRIDKFES